MPDNVLDMPTPDTSPEKLQEVTEQGIPQILQLINKNRKEGLENLRKKVESLQTDLETIRADLGHDEALMKTKNWSLENSLRSTQSALGSTETVLEALNSLIDMMINDLGGMVMNNQELQKGMMLAHSHLQTLLTLLEDKGVISDQEMKDTWEKIRGEVPTPQQ